MYSLVLCPPQQTVNYLQITRSKGVCNFLCETFVACVFKFAVCMGSVLISSHVFNNGIALHNCIFLICSWVLHVLFAIKKLWLCSENKKYITRTWGCPLNHWPSKKLELPWIYFDQVERYHDFKNLNIHSDSRETWH